MTIKLLVKPVYKNEIEYISEILFFEIIGANVTVEFQDGLKYNTLVIPNGKEIYFPDIFFNDFYLKGKLPSEVKYLESPYLSDLIPIIFGDPTIDNIDKGLLFGFDFLGACFFFLTCYEEFVIDKRDKYGRFLHEYSLSSQLEYIEYPVVDQIAYLIRCIFVENGVDINKKTSNINITCDVDWPYDYRLQSFKVAAHSAIYLFIKKKQFKVATNLILNFMRKNLGFTYNDEYRNAVTFIMEQCESLDKKGIFYFIPNKTHVLDTDQTLSSQKISELVLEIYNRGHIIGCHPGFLSTENSNEMYETFRIFHNELKKLIGDTLIHNRNHFLKWDINSTARLLQDQGVVIDSTLGFADHIGFRCGTAHDFTMFDLVKKERLSIKQRPLIIMDASVFHVNYQFLDYSNKTKTYLNKIVTRSLKYGGNCTILWHNTHLESEKDKDMYKYIISSEA